jgi:hypothetical protein
MDEEHVVGGTRIGWRDIPPSVLAWAEAELGSPIVAAVDERGGFSPGAATRLQCADGTHAFVKAVGDELNPISPAMHRRESAITARLPPSVMVPKLRAAYDDGSWVALLFDEIDGRLPRLPWATDELDRVLDAVPRLHDALTPCPIEDVATVGDLWAEQFDGWRSLMRDGAAASLDAWTGRHLDRLVAFEASWTAASEGDTLLHGDLRVDNILLSRDSVVFVDWANACRGAAWFDIVAMAPSVAMQGGPPPEAFVTHDAATAAADPDAVTTIIVAFTGYLVHRGTLPPPPGLPTLRSFQAAQGRVALEWLRERTGWP